MKKLLSLILTLALLSTMLVFGGASASAAAATVEKTYEPTAAVRIERSWNSESSAFDYTVVDMTNNESTSNIIMPINSDGDGRYMAYKIDLANVGKITSAKLKLTASKIDNGGDLNAYACSGTWEDLVNGTTTPTFGNLIKSVNSVSASGKVSRTIDITEYLQKKQNDEEDYAIVYVAQVGTGTPRGNYNGGFRLYQLASSDAPVLTIQEEVAGLRTKIMVEKEKSVSASESYHLDYAWKNTSAETPYQVWKNYNGYRYVRTGLTSGGYGQSYFVFDLSGIDTKQVDKAVVQLQMDGNNATKTIKATMVTGIETTLGALGIESGSSSKFLDCPTLPETTSVSKNFPSLSSYKATSVSVDIANIINAALINNESKVAILITNTRNDGNSETNGLRLYQAGHSKEPVVTISYTGELDTEAEETIAPNTTFTFKGEIATEDVPVRLVVALYAGDTFLGAVVTPDTAARELDVDLSAYPTATKVKCYFWNGDTLVPFMGVTEADIAAAA